MEDASEICCICSDEAKYKCPACLRRTCSLSCVREHKDRFGCLGTGNGALVPASKTQKYSESLFFQDYKFLETLQNNALNKKSLAEDFTEESNNDGNNSSCRNDRVKKFRKIQRVAKLAELQLLPETFSRARRNRTKLVIATGSEAAESPPNPESGPTQQSSRRAHVSWTVDILLENGPVGSLQQERTIHDILDTLNLWQIIAENDLNPISVEVLKVFLKVESKKVPESVIWREVPKENWKSVQLASILKGSRCFEYPIFKIVFEDS